MTSILDHNVYTGEVFSIYSPYDAYSTSVHGGYQYVYAGGLYLLIPGSETVVRAELAGGTWQQLFG